VDEQFGTHTQHEKFDVFRCRRTASIINRFSRWRKIRWSRRNATAHGHAPRAEQVDHRVKWCSTTFGTPQVTIQNIG
jgi:hypothetical protein